MGIWPFGKKQSKEIAKKRLQLILKYDRAGLPPNAIEEIKTAILNALKDFPFVDTSGVKIDVSTGASEKIELEIPVKI